MSLEQSKDGITVSNVKNSQLTPLRKEDLTDFAEELLTCILNEIPHVRNTVYHSCDLLVALIKRNGATWRDKALFAIKEKVL